MSKPHADYAEHEVVWDRFCDMLKHAGKQILRPEAPMDPFNRAEGYRYLSRLTRIALEMQVESGTAEFPTFMVPSHETAKIGADNPDNYYQVALINGEYSYRIRGNRGAVENINFSTKRGGYDTNGKLILSDLLEAKNMHFEADGSFELTLSQERSSGNWLKVTPDTTQVLVRQYLPRRREQKPAQITIERLHSTGEVPAPLDPIMFEKKLLGAAQFVENTARMFCDWTKSYLPNVNSLPPADQALCQSVGGDPNIFYYHGYWRLDDGEALVVRIPELPSCDYWNMVVQNYWMESLDFRYFDVCVNKETAKLDADGGVTVVIAHRDPGVPNWLSTAGHSSGTMCFRWVGASDPVHPVTEVVTLDALI
jgi:hypothetical protein